MKKLILFLSTVILLVGIILVFVGAVSVSTQTADAGVLTGTFTSSGGSFSSTQADDTSYFFVGTGSKDTDVDAYIELNFSIDSLGILEGAITDLNLSAIYCHDGSSTGGSCGGTAAEGTFNGDQNVEVYNFSSSSWYDIGNLRTDDSGSEVQSNFSVGGGFSDFVEDSTNIVRTRFQMNFTTGSAGNADGFLNLDYVTLNVSYNAPPNVTTLNFPTNNSYLNSNPIDFNFTVISDEFGFTNATLYGNWSGGWHANQTIVNTTINNGTVTNFTSLNLAEGTYFWNVLVHDNASVSQSDWFDVNYTFVVDTTNPKA